MPLGLVHSREERINREGNLSHSVLAIIVVDLLLSSKLLTQTVNLICMHMPTVASCEQHNFVGATGIRISRGFDQVCFPIDAILVLQ